MLLLLLCGCYDNHPDAATKDDAPARNHKIADLRTICQGGCTPISANIVCEGRVTSSDAANNFYRTLVVEDESGGVEVKLGTHSTASRYPIGLSVSLRLNGTALMVENGVVQMGLPPQSFDSSPREMESQVVIDEYVIRSTMVEPIAPMLCSVPNLNIEMCGRLVVVEDVLHTPLADDVASKGYHRFEDSDGNAIYLYISPYAAFASEPLPNSATSICGILYREVVSRDLGEQYVVKPRSQDDIQVAHTAR